MKTAKVWTPQLAAEWIDEKLESKKKQFTQTDRVQIVNGVKNGNGRVGRIFILI
jgi:hypothetical protein